ncbi:MAG: PQQ-binding-like beta-propeller repeat protein [Planctomycetota bacterium]
MLSQLAVSTLLAGSFSSDADSRTWPQWRGPDRDGVVEGPQWPSELTEETVVESWSIADLGESYAAPIVSESLVFTVSTEDDEEIAQAYDRATGKLAWETRWEGSMTVPFFAAKNGSWIRSTPAFDGKTVYVGGMEERLVALDAESGSMRWQVDFVERFGTEMGKFGFICSPLVADGAVYVQAGSSLVRLDAKTGETVWRSTEAPNGASADSAFSSPILAELAGREQLVVQSRTHLAGIDPKSGESLWSTAVEAFRGMNILTPQPFGDAIFTSAYGGRAHLYAVENDDDGIAVTEAWSGRAQGYMTSPVVLGDHAYLFLRSNRFTCVDLTEGTDAWISEPTGDEYWSLVGQGDRILALADTGILRLVRATPEKYDVLGEVDLVEGPSWAHLAVTAPAEGDEGAEIFVRAQTSLHAYRWK